MQEGGRSDVASIAKNTRSEPLWRFLLCFGLIFLRYSGTQCSSRRLFVQGFNEMSINYPQWLASPLLATEASEFAGPLIAKAADYVDPRTFFAGWSLEMVHDIQGQRIVVYIDPHNHVYSTVLNILFRYSLVTSADSARQSFALYLRPTFLLTDIARYVSLAITACRYSNNPASVFLGRDNYSGEMLVFKGTEDDRVLVAFCRATDDEVTELQHEIVRLAAFNSAFHQEGHQDIKVTPVVFPDGTLVSVQAISNQIRVREPRVQQLGLYRDVLAVTYGANARVYAGLAKDRVCTVQVLIALVEAEEHLNVVPVVTFGIGHDMMGRPNPWKQFLNFRVEKKARSHLRVLNKDTNVALVELIARSSWKANARMRGSNYDRVLLQAMRNALAAARDVERAANVLSTSIVRSICTILAQADVVNQRDALTVLSTDDLNEETVLSRIEQLLIEEADFSGDSDTETLAADFHDQENDGLDSEDEIIGVAADNAATDDDESV
jgi:hypothetical protein